MADKLPQLDWKSGRAESILLDEGFVSDLVEHDFFATAPTGTSTIKVRLSGVWVEKPIKVYVSGVWISKPLKVWNNSSWVPL